MDDPGGPTLRDLGVLDLGLLALGLTEAVPAAASGMPVKRSRAAREKARGHVINLPGQMQLAKGDKLPSVPEDGDDDVPCSDAAPSGENRPSRILLGRGLRGYRLRLSLTVTPMPPLIKDVFFAVPKGQAFPEVPLLGDESCEDFLILLSGKVKAGVITQEM